MLEGSIGRERRLTLKDRCYDEVAFAGVGVEEVAEVADIAEEQYGNARVPGRDARTRTRAKRS